MPGKLNYKFRETLKNSPSSAIIEASSTKRSFKMNTLSFASLAYDNKKKKTKREKFLQEMDRVIPWKDLTQIIEEYYPKAGNGRQPMLLEMMLRIYFMQQWYALSDL